MSGRQSLLPPSAPSRSPAAFSPTAQPVATASHRAPIPPVVYPDPMTLPVELVRLSVETPTGELDLSLPDDMTPAGLLTVVLATAPALREQSVGRGGWLLARREGGALPGGRTLSELGVVEGAVLRLVGAADAAPAPIFDDVADAVAEASRQRPYQWTAAVSRRAAGGIATGFGALGLVGAMFSGPPWAVTAIAAAAVAALLLSAAALVSRGLAQVPAAVALGLAAAGSAGVAAATAIAGSRPALDFVAPEFASGLGGVVLVSAGAVAFIGRRAVSLMTVCVAALLGVIVAVVGSVWTVPRVGIGALLVLLALLLTPAIPTLAFRLARFELPPLPANAEDLAAINATVDTSDVSSRTAVATAYVTALVAGSALVGTAGLILLGAGRNTGATVLVGTTSLAVLLRSRLFLSVPQRLPYLLAGSIGYAIAALRVGLDVGGRPGAAWFAVATGVGLVVALGFAARSGPAKSPFYGRAAELVEVLLALALIPLIATVMGLVGLIRGLGG